MSENLTWHSKMQERKNNKTKQHQNEVQSGNSACAYFTCLKTPAYFIPSCRQVCPGAFLAGPFICLALGICRKEEG